MEEKIEEVKETENEETTIDFLNERVDNLINNLSERQKSVSEEPAKIKELNDKINMLEEMISKMVNSGSYTPVGSDKERVPAILEETVLNSEKQNVTNDNNIRIFDKIQDMEESLK